MIIWCYTTFYTYASVITAVVRGRGNAGEALSQGRPIGTSLPY
jgi:hypothetical protein